MYNQSKLLKELRRTFNASFSHCLPLWEGYGTTAYDFSIGMAQQSNSTLSGVTLAKPGPNEMVPLVMGFDGVDDKITMHANCSVKARSKWTFMGVFNIVNTGAKQQIWYESTADDATAARFSVFLDTDCKLNCEVRAGLAAEAVSNQITDAAIPEGFCMLHVAVLSLGATDTIKLYRNGTLLASSGTVAIAGAVANTDSASGVIAGYKLEADPCPFAGDMGMLTRWNTNLQQYYITRHAQMGGFA